MIKLQIMSMRKCTKSLTLKWRGGPAKGRPYTLLVPTREKPLLLSQRLRERTLSFECNDALSSSQSIKVNLSLRCLFATPDTRNVKYYLLSLARAPLGFVQHVNLSLVVSSSRVGKLSRNKEFDREHYISLCARQSNRSILSFHLTMASADCKVLDYYSL